MKEELVYCKQQGEGEGVGEGEAIAGAGNRLLPQLSSSPALHMQQRPDLGRPLLSSSPTQVAARCTHVS